MGIVLDTSVLIAAEKQRFDLEGLFAAYKQEPFFIAAITAAELLHGVERASPGGRRQKRSKYVEWVLSHIEAIDFDLSLARQHATLWAALETTGEPIGAHDLLIAATATQFDHALATLNQAEFKHVAGLRPIDLAPFLRS